MFLKPDLHTIVTVAEYACDDAPKKILKLSTSISCKRSVLVIITTIYMETKPCLKGLKTCLQASACDPYDLYGDQALTFFQCVKTFLRI